MKRCGLTLVGCLASCGLAMILSGCVEPAGRISVGAAFYYGPYHGWVYDGPWLYGWPWWHGGVRLGPPPIYLGRPPHWPHIPDRPRVHRGP